MRDTKALIWLNKVIKGKRWIVIALMTAQSLIAFCNVINAWYLHKMIDAVSIKNKEALIANGIIIVVITLISLIVSALNRHLSEYGRVQTENNLKTKLFERLLNSNYANVVNYHSQEWMNKLTSDTAIVANGVITILPNLFSMLVQLFAAITVMFRIIPQYSMILVPTGIVLIIVTYFCRKKLKQLHTDIQESNGILKAFLSEHLENLIVIKAFNKERNTLDLAKNKMQDYSKTRMKRSYFSNAANVGYGLLMRGSYVLCLLVGAYLIFNGSLSYGSFIAMIQLIGQIQAPFANVSGIMPRYYAAMSSLDRIMLAEDFDEDISGTDINYDFSKIVLENVSFTYKSKNEIDRPVVFDNLSINIANKDFIGIKGDSGSGKSTALKVLMCLYPVDSGCRYIVDNNNQKHELTPSDRSLFAYVPQGNQLMSGSIKDVVTFNDADSIDMDRFIESLKISCAYEFVSKLEGVYDYVLKERGTGLSEGQIQRLAIARAIYSNKPILLLDEATSSLDEKTEIELLENLKKLNNRTVILVSHRNTALKYCDKVINFN
ncbi:MAG: ABC transporter ATP-binding protein [Firmicutes bacterium]|nr:ABC transporter ATP-binding protein [Candidatus Colivicinus equi]